jgi:riboflavin kinase/FMN adenylyltransferase
MREIATRTDGETVVVTFEPHPRMVLAPYGTPVRLINIPHRKYQILESLGIDHVVVLNFTLSFAQIPWEAFVKEFLSQKIKVKCLVVGYDHRFGQGREGDHEKLMRIARDFNFCVEEIPPFYLDGHEVSSTRIRQALHSGNIRLANFLLGYEYSITGKVVHGNRIGHKLSFPTANIEADDKYKLIAANGVYVARAEYQGRIYGGMCNIGNRPTIEKSSFAVEIHIFDFNREIYGENLTIYFVDRLRNEVRFESMEALKAQLVEDKKMALEILERIPDGNAWLNQR